MNCFLLEAQSVDQAGVRSGYSCDNHLCTATLLIEMHGEYRLPLWIVAVDFKKAFDSIGHHSLWKSLLVQGVPRVFADALMRLYRSQSGCVKTDCLSKPFHIKRGVRQGVPMSPMRFSAALETIRNANS